MQSDRDNLPLQTDDWLAAHARRYPLLTAAEEQEIDGLKWRATGAMLDCMAADAAACRLLAEWAGACSATPPSIDHFQEREHYFLLRRELRDFLPGGASHQAARELAAALAAGPGTSGDCAAQLAELQLPASLIAALAGLLLAGDGEPEGVAAALARWRRHWRAPQRTGRVRAATRRRLQVLLVEYLAARERLVAHNLRLVHSVARQHQSSGLPLTDLIQEGTLGLMRAAEKFDHRRGYRFSTYAYNWINQAVGRSIADSATSIRYPTQVREQVNRIHALRAEAQRRGEAPPDDAELARQLGMDEDKLRGLRQLGNITVSLASPQFADDGLSLEETLPGGPFGEAGEGAERSSLQRMLLQEMQRLSEPEQQVVLRRWGISGYRPQTRAEVAEQLQVSREWVRQLEQSALRKLSESPAMAAAAEDYDVA